MAKKLPILCPSARCEEGSNLLGVVQADGKVGFLPERMPVDREFVEIARQGRVPEKRFRFSNGCVRGACKQWTGERCGVAEEMLELIGPEHRVAELPACSIREQCRWFEQRGAEACSICPLVITDLMVDEDEAPAEEAAAG